MLNTLIAVASLVLGWLLKVFSDRMSQRTTFDHRIRLEKEYGLYCDLWDKLFELRRATGQLVEPLGSANTVRHDKDFFDLFNAYQGAVHKSEPFISTAVFDPASKIATLARRISSNIGERESLSGERRSHGADSEWLGNERERLREENAAAFNEIETHFRATATAIRQRVSP